MTRYIFAFLAALLFPVSAAFAGAGGGFLVLGTHIPTYGVIGAIVVIVILIILWRRRG